MSELRLKDVTKKYRDETAVNEATLKIEDGEFVTLVGPSGCGKSTTLETVAGLTKPTSGSIYIGDREVTQLPPKDRGVAMVFQNIALFPHLDIYDNMSFGLRLRDYSKDEIDRRVEDAAETVQLEGMLDRMPDELSGGQQQRVAIGRAIVRDPEVFLMDEPLANLDAKLRVHMRTELQRLHKELETTTIYVTHDQAEAMTMSDRIVVLNQGELQQFASPLECYNQPANLFVAGFIGSPSMNFVDARLGESGFETDYFEVKVDPAAIPEVEPGDDVTLGIRPEDVYLADADDVSEPTAPISVSTDVLEPMGDETFVYLLFADDAVQTMDRSTDEELLMSVDPGSDIEADAHRNVVFDRANVHLFDAETKEAICHELPTQEASIESS